MLPLVLSFALAALPGFAAQRASICNVRAVAEEAFAPLAPGTNAR